MSDLNKISPLWDHIEELRKTLLFCLGIVVIGMAISLYFYHPIIKWLTSPLQNPALQGQAQVEEIRQFKIYNPEKNSIIYSLPKTHTLLSISPEIKKIGPTQYLLEPGGILEAKASHPSRLVILSPIEGFTSILKITFWIGLVGTSPLWIIVLFKFIAPGLNPEEKKIALPFLSCAFIFLLLGVFFAFYLTIPCANLFFKSFNQGIGVDTWSFKSYIEYTLAILLGNALAFESALLLILLIHFRVFHSTTLIKGRRYAIVFIFILSALLTPPDVLSQLLLALPLIILFEGAIIYAKIREKKA